MSVEEPKIRYVVLDVLKPHQPRLSDFAIFLAGMEGVTKVDISVVEMDEKTESLRVILDGSSIEFEELREHMSKQGAVIHSLDRVVVE
jgi:hypothetical protein